MRVRVGGLGGGWGGMGTGGDRETGGDRNKAEEKGENWRSGEGMRDGRRKDGGRDTPRRRCAHNSPLNESPAIGPSPCLMRVKERERWRGGGGRMKKERELVFSPFCVAAGNDNRRQIPVQTSRERHNSARTYTHARTHELTHTGTVSQQSPLKAV